MHEHGTYLGKAIRPDGHEHDIWLPFDSPYLADLVEAFTLAGMERIRSLHEALGQWLDVHGQPQQKRAPVVGAAPGVPVRWTQTELDAWGAYLRAKPRMAWVPEDWSMLIEWLLQTHWHPKWASDMASWLATKSTLLGQIEASLAANPLSAGAAAAVAAALPASIPVAVEIGLPVSKITESMVAFAAQRCASAIVDMGERMRTGIRAIVLDQQRTAMLGGKVENIELKLFEKFATANRDWRRIAVTEASENAAQGVVAASKPGDRLKRVEQYKGVCEWCHRINGLVATVVDPSKPNKNGETEIWPGKTNIGRSSAPRMRIGGQMYDRSPDEMWWVASGAQHPHCRGVWLPLSGVDPAKLDEFLRGVKARMAKHQAAAASAGQS